MKAFITAIMETIVLLISIAIVLIGAALLKLELPFQDFKESNPGNFITVAGALGMVPENTVLAHEEMSREFAKFMFGKGADIEIPEYVTRFLNHEVNAFEVRVIVLYPFTGMIAGLLCLIFGVGYPFAKFRGFSPGRYFDDMFVDRSRVYVDNRGIEQGYVGETRSCLMTMITWMFMLGLSNIWGVMLPVFIVLNIVLAIVILVVQIIHISIVNRVKRVKRMHEAGKPGEEIYTLMEEYGLFMVAGDKHPDRVLFFKKYWNAVIAKRIMECDRARRMYDKQDAVDTIQFGDEKLHEYHENSRLLQLFQMLFDAQKRNEAFRIKNDISSMNYTYSKMVKNSQLLGYIIKYNRGNFYMPFHILGNCALMYAVLNCDAQETVFELKHWNKWAPLGDKEKLAFMENGPTYINAPVGE